MYNIKHSIPYATVKQTLPNKIPFPQFQAACSFTNPMSFHFIFEIERITNRRKIPNNLWIKFSARNDSSVLIKKYSMILAAAHIIKINQQAITGCFLILSTRRLLIVFANN